MIRTITIGKFVSIQGVFVKQLPDGRISVRVGKKIYSGTPVTKFAA